MESGQLSQQFFRSLVLVTFEWQDTPCFVEMADNLSTWVVLEIRKPVHLNHVKVETQKAKVVMQGDKMSRMLMDRHKTSPS